MKQGAPTGFLPPEASQLKPDRQQFQSRKRPYEENRGRGYFEHREDRRWVYEAAVTLALVGLYIHSLVLAGDICTNLEGLSRDSLCFHTLSVPSCAYYQIELS